MERGDRVGNNNVPLITGTEVSSTRHCVTIQRRADMSLRLLSAHAKTSLPTWLCYQIVNKSRYLPSSAGLSWRTERMSWPNSSRHRQAACEQSPRCQPVSKLPKERELWDSNPVWTRSEGSGLLSMGRGGGVRWPSGQAAEAAAERYHMVGRKRKLVLRPERTATAAVTWPEDRQTVSPLLRPPAKRPPSADRDTIVF